MSEEHEAPRGRPRSPRRAKPIVGRILVPVDKAPGTPPGMLVPQGPRKVDEVQVRLIDYDEDGFRDDVVEDISLCFPIAELPTVTWVNVEGLHEPAILEQVGGHFGFHRLVLEDVLSPRQRPKVEDYGDYVFIVLKMLDYRVDTKAILAEQVSFIVGNRYVFSFQERAGDVFEPIRQRLREAKGRLRSRGPDYLVYALLDAVVDSYFRILELMGDEIERLEELALHDPPPEVMHGIHDLRREMLIVRRAVWPLRESIGVLTRGEIALIGTDARVYLRDVHDHAVQAIDTVETLREVLSSAMDLYLSAVSNRMNEVMKVLTIIATIFIPLSFFAGIYGMNFDYMPELSIPWAYPTLLVAMISAGGAMLWYFKRKGWF
jgi:magnesium transporter